MILYDKRLDFVRVTLSQVKHTEIEVMDGLTLHNWYSNARRKLSVGTWSDESDYDATKIYDGYFHYLSNLGYGLKSE